MASERQQTKLERTRKSLLPKLLICRLLATFDRYQRIGSNGLRVKKLTSAALGPLAGTRHVYEAGTSSAAPGRSLPEILLPKGQVWGKSVSKGTSLNAAQ